jgi:hypothetical protein
MYPGLTLIVVSVAGLGLFAYVLIGLYRYISSLPNVTSLNSSSRTKAMTAHHSMRVRFH